MAGPMSSMASSAGLPGPGRTASAGGVFGRPPPSPAHSSQPPLPMTSVSNGSQLSSGAGAGGGWSQQSLSGANTPGIFPDVSLAETAAGALTLTGRGSTSTTQTRKSNRRIADSPCPFLVSFRLLICQPFQLCRGEQVGAILAPFRDAGQSAES